MSQEVHIGVQSGLTYNTANRDLTDRNLERNGPLPGFWIQIPCHIRISKKATIETGVGLIYKNSQVYRTGQFSGAYENSINQFLQVPIAVKVCLLQSRSLKFVAGPGFYLGYWLSSTRKGKIFNLYNSEINLNNGQSELLLSLSPYQEKSNLHELGYNRLEVGGFLSSAMQYAISSHSSLVCDISIMKSLYGSQDSDLGFKKYHNTTFIFSLGFLKSL